MAAPGEQHLKVLNAKTVSLNFAFSSTSQILTFNISTYSVTVFSFTRGRHSHKFEIFTITVTTLHLQLISIFNHWPKTILSFTRGRHLCNFHSPGGATFSTVIRQGAPLKFRFSAFLKCPHPKAPTLISDPASLTNIPYTSHQLQVKKHIIEQFRSKISTVRGGRVKVHREDYRMCTATILWRTIRTCLTCH